MRYIYFLVLVLFLHPSLSHGQMNGVYGVVDKNLKYQNPTFQDGNAGLGQTYNKTACGLNWTGASLKLGQRFHNATLSSCDPVDGTVQPATLNVSGIPTCYVVDKAYLWCSTSGNGIAITATLQNPLGTTTNFPMTLIGSDIDKGWGATGSYSYRADITSAITGNGNYILSGLPTYPNYPVTGNDVDGATIFIIYRDLNATYSASMIIDDGCMVGGIISHTITGFTACATTSNAQAILIVSDMQDVNCTPILDNQITANGMGPYVAPQEDWWNTLFTTTTVTAGQNSSFFEIDNTLTDDLYDFLMAGLYYQTTTCTVCNPTAITATASSTPDTCGKKVGTATANPSGGSGSYTYSWNSIPVQTTQTATNLAAGSYTVTITDTNGCMGTKVVMVTSTSAPAITLNPPTSSICNGSSVLLTGGGGVSYIWSPTSGLSSSTGTSVTASPSVTTTYTVVGTNGSGCTNTATATVTISPGPNINVNPSSPILCNGQSVNLNASGGNTYVWSPSNGLSAGTGVTVTANPGSTTTYTVTGTSGSGCTNTAIATVTVNPLPNVQVNPNAPVLCTGQFVALTASGANSYIWSPSNGLSSGTGSVVSANPNTTTTYTVIGTDANSCTNTATVTVTVNSSAVITVNPTTPNICNGKFVTLTAGGGNTYIWSPASGLSSSSGTVVSANPTSTTTYTVTGTTGGGCSGTAIATVTVNQIPVITVNPTAPVLCNGQSVNLTGGGGNSYIWNPTSGLSSGSGTTVSANPSSTSSYTVTGTDGNGCSNTASATVTVNPLPTVTVDPNSPSICAGQSVTLTAGGGNTYVWSPTNGLSAGTGSVVSATPTSTASYTVTGTDGNSCTNTAVATVTVNPLPVVDAGQDAHICPNDSAQLNVTGPPPGSTYSWTPSTDLSCTSCSNTFAYPQTTATYVVTVKSPAGCSAQDSVSVIVTPLSPSAGPDTAVCDGSTVDLNASGGTNYQWSPSTNLFNPNSADPTATMQVTTTYTVTVSTGACTATATVSVTVFPTTPTPTIKQSADTLYCSIDPSYSTYQWYYHDTIIAGETKTFYVASQNGNYNIAVTDTNGCTISVGINIILTTGLETFSDIAGFVLSPNPATNELFITGRGFNENTSILIFNAIGEKVREERINTSPPTTLKDEGLATINISDLSAGIYFVKVQQSHGNWVGRFLKE